MSWLEMKLLYEYTQESYISQIFVTDSMHMCEVMHSLNNTGLIKKDAEARVCFQLWLRFTNMRFPPVRTQYYWYTYSPLYAIVTLRCHCSVPILCSFATNLLLEVCIRGLASRYNSARNVSSDEPCVPYLVLSEAIYCAGQHDLPADRCGQVPYSQAELRVIRNQSGRTPRIWNWNTRHFSNTGSPDSICCWCSQGVMWSQEYTCGTVGSVHIVENIA
jgi:hypothetical protein